MGGMKRIGESLPNLRGARPGAAESSSRAVPEALPTTWIERLFEVMLTHYGKAFLDKWAVVSAEKLKAMWAEKLAGLSSAELKRGVEALEECAFPPSQIGRAHV